MVSADEKDMFRQAMAAGQNIDLNGCVYGIPHINIPVPQVPYNYYYFLAGLVKTERARYILEIGTHFGGSIMSMSRALTASEIKESRLVTIDITNDNTEGFSRYPHIKRIRGDAIKGSIVKKAIACFDREIDILYIDAVHDSRHTLKCIRLYAGALRPKYIILDDIYRDSMKALWGNLAKLFGRMAVDVSEISKREAIVGGTSDGFGVIICRYPSALARIEAINLILVYKSYIYDPILTFLSRILPRSLKDRLKIIFYGSDTKG